MKWSFTALGTTWWIELFEDLSDKRCVEVKDFCASFVSTYENNYSRFKPDSVLSTLNRDRSLKDPSPEFVTLLEYGKQLYLRSDTHFNFLTGHILESKGYDADYSFTDRQTNEQPGNPITDLEINTKQITLTHGNVDLGGYGKGYLIDLLADKLRRRFDLRQFLINGGGDMFATHQNGEAITIYLEHPTQPGKAIASTSLLNQGFAASSPHQRVWKNATGIHHHIVTEKITADATFIKAATATDADAFATTTLVMDNHQLEKLIKTEHLAVARFNVQSDTLAATKNFN